MSRLRLLPAVVLIAAAPWLGGCSGGDDDPAAAAPDPVAETTPGVTGELPADFPTEKIPLIDAEVVSALATEEGGYHVTVAPTKSYAKAFQAALKKLKGAGFKVKYNQKLGDVRTAKLASPAFTAVLSGGEGGAAGQTSLTYLIEKKV
ncbi:hypothetical protein [Nocardioides speluncae]|uniref:hypothetical protein n=1 Tax=Nocardioides speluncae TaxID=2670337 RepID=UPI0012B183C3|nr:hypothetical protein [Nocardioides speluncae]